jgi:hypothetical protein
MNTGSGAPCALRQQRTGAAWLPGSRHRRPRGGEGLVVQAACVGGVAGIVAGPPGGDGQVAGRRPQLRAGRVGTEPGEHPGLTTPPVGCGKEPGMLLGTWNLENLYRPVRPAGRGRVPSCSHP